MSFSTTVDFLCSFLKLAPPAPPSLYADVVNTKAGSVVVILLFVLAIVVEFSSLFRLRFSVL